MLIGISNPNSFPENVSLPALIISGVACLVTFILRHQQNIDVPDIQGYCYAPPGVLMSAEAAEHSKSFISCGVVECDIVPRMSLGALRRMERELNQVLLECDQPKNKLFFGSLANCLGKIPCFKCFKRKTQQEKELEELKRRKRKRNKEDGDENAVICVSPGDCEAQIGSSDGMRTNLLDEGCHCGKTLMDNSRTKSHVRPHERHDASTSQVVSNDPGALPILEENEGTPVPLQPSSSSFPVADQLNRLHRLVI